MGTEPLGKNGKVRELLRLSREIETGNHPPDILQRIRDAALEVLFQIQRKVMTHEQPNDPANPRMAPLRRRSDEGGTSDSKD